MWRPWRSRATDASPGSRFGANLWLVARANMLAQALPLLAAPLLTRLYTPADFGTLALFASVLGLGTAAATLRFEWSVPNARSSGMAAALLGCGALALGVATLLLALAWPRGEVSWGELHDGGAAFALLLPLALAGAGLQQLMQAWHVRSTHLAAVGRAKMLQSTANVAVSVMASGLGGLGLLLGALAGAWVGLETLLLRARGLRRAAVRGRRLMGRALQRFGAEAAWSTLASLLNTLSFALVPLMLARHYGVAEVGYYSLMQRVALGPVALVGSAVAQSFWVEAARLAHVRNAELEALFRRSARRLALISLPLSLVALAAPWYIGPIFGAARWADAGWVVAAAVPLLIGQVVVSPLSHLIVHHKQHWQALWDLGRILAVVATIEGLGRAGVPFVGVVLATSCVMAVTYGVLYLMNLRALRLRADA